MLARPEYATEEKVTKLQENVNDLLEFALAQARRCRSSQPGVDEQQCDADETERGILKRVLEIGRQAMCIYAEEVGPGDEGTRLELAEIKYERRTRRPYKLLTVFGAVEIERFGYYTPMPGHNRYIYPSDWRMNLPDRKSSYLRQEILARLALEQTYQQSADVFKEFFGISVSPRTVETVIDETAIYHERFAEDLEVPPLPEGHLQVVSFDGKGVPMRRNSDELEQEATPSYERPAPHKKNKKEAIVGLEYTIEPHYREVTDIVDALVEPASLSDEQRARLHGRRATDNIYYQASVEFTRLSVMLQISDRIEQRNVDDSTQVVCLVDGARTLISGAESVFPDAEIVLDLIHVVGYLGKAVEALCPNQNDKKRKLLRAYLTATLEGRVGHVVGGMRQRMSNERLRGQRKWAVTDAIRYFENHKQYMQYDRYLAAGYPVTTGVVESACGHLVMNRMEKAGARWHPSGAEPMLRLRAVEKSGCWREYHSYRKQHQAQDNYREFAINRAA